MALTTTDKAQLVQKFQRAKNDTGSPEVQVALLTGRIQYLTEHFQTHKHDFHSRYGLTKLVSQRRTQLDYLKRMDVERYRKLIAELDLRR